MRHQCEQWKSERERRGTGYTIISQLGAGKGAESKHDKQQTTADLVVVGALEMNAEETGCWRSQPNELFGLHVG